MVLRNLSNFVGVVLVIWVSWLYWVFPGSSLLLGLLIRVLGDWLAYTTKLRSGYIIVMNLASHCTEVFHIKKVAALCLSVLTIRSVHIPCGLTLVDTEIWLVLMIRRRLRPSLDAVGLEHTGLVCVNCGLHVIKLLEELHLTESEGASIRTTRRVRSWWGVIWFFYEGFLHLIGLLGGWNHVCSAIGSCQLNTNNLGNWFPPRVLLTGDRPMSMQFVDRWDWFLLACNWVFPGMTWGFLRRYTMLVSNFILAAFWLEGLWWLLVVCLGLFVAEIIHFHVLERLKRKEAYIEFGIETSWSDLRRRTIAHDTCGGVRVAHVIVVCFFTSLINII